MKIPFLAWLLQGIPECIALAALSVTLAGGSITREKVIKIGCFQAVTTYIVRLMPFTPGVHVLILLTSLAFFLIFLGKINLKLSVIASAITICLLLVFEVLYNTLIFTLGIVKPDELMSSTVLRIMLGYPQVIFLFASAFLINKLGWNLRDLLKGINESEEW